MAPLILVLGVELLVGSYAAQATSTSICNIAELQFPAVSPRVFALAHADSSRFAAVAASWALAEFVKIFPCKEAIYRM